MKTGDTNSSRRHRAEPLEATSRRRLHLTIGALLLLLDLWSKDLVYTILALDGTRIPIAGGTLGLVCRTNPAGAFGLFSGIPPELRMPLIVLLTLSALGATPFLLKRALPRGVSAAVPLTLIFAGATGNLVDRFWRGAVIDFIDIRFGDAIVLPTFNLADMFIVVGIGWALFTIAIHWRRSRSGERPIAPAPAMTEQTFSVVGNNRPMASVSMGTGSSPILWSEGD